MAARIYFLLDWSTYDEFRQAFVDVTDNEITIRMQIANRESARRERGWDWGVALTIYARIVGEITPERLGNPGAGLNAVDIIPWASIINDVNTGLVWRI